MDEEYLKFTESITESESNQIFHYLLGYYYTDEKFKEIVLKRLEKIRNEHLDPKS